MAFALVLLLGWLLTRLENALLYHPTVTIRSTPASLGIHHEDVRIPTTDGETLHGWWIPHPQPGAPVLLFFHGNGGNREDRLHNLIGLHQAGLAVLIIDYRGYGGSTGSPAEAGLITDGLSAYDWLTARAPVVPIVFFGRSLGGAVALQVAARILERGGDATEKKDERLAALILESTFTSIREMVPLAVPFPGATLLARSRFDSLALIPRLKLPLLIIHGEADRLIPFAMGKKLFKAATSDLKQFFPVPDGGHNDTYLRAGPGYYQRLMDFIGRIRP